MIINRPQATDPGPITKLMQHPYIRCALAMRKMGKTTPRSLLGQESYDAVVAVSPHQRPKQMHAPQLCRTETTSPPHPTAPSKQLVDKLIRHIIGNNFQKPHCPNRRQVFAHEQRTTLLDATCRYQTKKQQFIDVNPTLPVASNSFRNTLRRDGGWRTAGKIFER